MTYNPNFDIDLQFGLIYEKRLKRLLKEDGKIEVKTERDTWATTGNIAVEIRFKGQPSGLAKTKADWWFHILTLDGEMVTMVCFPVDKLKQIVKELLDKKLVKKVMGGDNNDSELLLVPIDKLLSKKFFNNKGVVHNSDWHIIGWLTNKNEEIGIMYNTYK